MTKKYDIIYSIGTDCGCAMNLKILKLRRQAGPFDWLTGADIPMRFKCIKNAGRDFMEFDDFIPREKDPNVENDNHCDYYTNANTGFSFLHDFPIGVPFVESYPSVREKYARRFNNFYMNLKTKRRVLLVYFNQWQSSPDDTWITECKSLCQHLGREIDFLIIEHADGVHELKPQHLAHNIIKYETDIRIKNSRGTYVVHGRTEVFRKILAGYKLAIPERKLVKYMWLWCKLHVFAPLIPDGKRRHKIYKNLQHKIGDLYRP